MTNKHRVAATAFLLAVGSAPASADTIVPAGDIGNEVWSVAASPYHVLGPIRVVPGATLVIEAGVWVEFAEAPQGRIGLQVDGSLVVKGRPEAPVTMASTVRSPGSWAGITSGSLDGTLELLYLTLHDPSVGVSFGGPSNARLYSTGLTVRRASVAGVAITGDADVTLDRFTSIDSRSAAYNTGASVTFTNCLVRGGPNARHGIRLNVGGDAAPTGAHALRLINCTLDRLPGSGVQASALDASASVTLEVKNTIVSRMGTVGIGASAQSGGTVLATVEHSNVWGNDTDYYGMVAPGAGAISQEPGFASDADLRLQAGSPCIDAGTDDGAPPTDLDGAMRPADGDATVGAFTDMGAYERSGAPPMCGNGVTESGEDCDDGAANGEYDACSGTCDGPGPHCGDAMVDVGVEACDDGNADDGDACLATCVAAACGDGLTQLGVEACDDGNVTSGDGCDANCTIETTGTGPGPDPDADDPGGCNTGGGRPIGGLLGLGILVALRRRRGTHARTR